jgi:hypothetical protein
MRKGRIMTEGDMSKIDERKQSPSSEEDPDDLTKKSRTIVHEKRGGSTMYQKEKVMKILFWNIRGLGGKG